MTLGPLVGSIGLITVVALLVPRHVGYYQRPERFILATSPGSRNVLWAPLPSLHDLTLPAKDRLIPDAQILIDGAASKCSGWICSEHSNRGLEEPVGLALYQKGSSSWLYISDPKVGFLYRYEISRTWRNALVVGPQELVASNLKDSAYWLTVDGFGNLFYSDQEAGGIFVIGAEDAAKGIPQGRRVLEHEPHVAGPAGLAADAGGLFWANLKGDQSTGTLVHAYQAKNSSARVLAGNRDMDQADVKDICLASSNVFFTGDGKSLFAVKADGSGNVTEVASLKEPKGCAYDQETTLYVADRGANAIYSLPGNMWDLRRAKQVQQVANMASPHQIAVFYSSSNKFLRAVWAAD